MSKILQLTLSAAVVVTAACTADTAEAEDDRTPAELAMVDESADGTVVDGASAELTADGSLDEDTFRIPDEPLNLEPIEGVEVVEAGEASPLNRIEIPLGGEIGLAIEPGTPEPTVAEAAYVSEGTGNDFVGRNGIAAIEYVMASFDGEIVERSNDLADPMLVIVGSPEDSPPDAFGIPSALENALKDRKVGSRIKVSFPPGMPGLPPFLDPEQAHVLVVDIIDFQAVGGTGTTE